MNIQGIQSLISAPQKAQTASSNATSGTGGSGGSTNGTSPSSLQTMFLNLLVTELQNQDPTQPVDPTQMVGQMISLNELDQLISINQILSGLGTTPPVTTGSTSAQSADSSAQSGTHNIGVSTLAHLTEPLAFQPIPGNTSPAANSPMSLYNLYGNIGAPAAGFNHFISLGGK